MSEFRIKCYDVKIVPECVNEIEAVIGDIDIPSLGDAVCEMPAKDQSELIEMLMQNKQFRHEAEEQLRGHEDED